MKNLTRLLCLILVAAMLTIAFASCVGETETKAETEKETESETTTTPESDTKTGDTESETDPESDTQAQTENETESETESKTEPGKDELETPKNVNIVCIGDSITQGTGTLSAYRYYLYEMLYSAGCVFKFTGYEKSVDPRLPEAYSYHGGYGGAVIGPNNQEGARSTYDYLPQYINSNVGVADMALVMLGHNNYYHLIDVDNMEMVYKKFINRVLAIQPNIVLYCGTMVKQASGQAPDVYKGYYGEKGLNGMLEGIINDLKASDPQKYANVYFVDLCNNTVFDPNVDFNPGDGAHPNESGQAKLAKSWYDAIVDKVLEINQQGDPNYKGDVRVTGVKLSDTQVTIGTGEGKTIKGIVTPSNALVFTMLWSSSDESIATVDTLGTITGVSEGTCTITGKTLDGGYTATCEVTVFTSVVYDYETIFDDQFVNSTTGNKWEGKTVDYIYTDASKLLLWFMARTFTVNTSKEIACGDNFKITGAIQITGNEGSSDANYVSIQYDKLTMKVMSAGTAVKLVYDGKEIGSASIPYKSDYNDYTLRYIDGKVSVLRNGEVLIEKTIDGDLADSAKIILSSKEPNRCVQMNNFVVEAVK